MTTPATAASRRLATAVLTGVVLVPVAGLLAAPAFADDAAPAASATPTVGIGEPAFVDASPAPTASEWPDSGGWIIGGTLQEGTAAGPKAAPAKAPAKAPVKAPTKPAVAAPPARVVTVTAPAARPQTVTGPAATAAPTALPFTGPGRLATQLTAGVGLVLVGGVLTGSVRTKRTMTPLR